MIGLECLHATAEISERSDVIRAFPKRSKSSCNFARSAKGLTTKRRKKVQSPAKQFKELFSLCPNHSR